MRGTTIPREPIVRFVRDPDLPQIEARFSLYRQKAFEKHTHDAYSIGIVTRGRTRFELYRPGLETVTVSRGDLVLIHPGEVHACNPLEGSELTYYMLYVEPALMEKVIDGPGGALTFPQPVVRDAGLYRAMVEVCHSLFRAQSRLEIESQLYASLAQIILCYTARMAAPPEPARAVERLRPGYDYLMANLAQNVSLQELAACSGMSPYHFLRAFHQQYGLPPHTYQLQQRINQARRLLAKGLPIVTVAAEVGFADQSHFTRKFKASVGVTPKQYQTTLTTQCSPSAG